jgi:hypothetical protein
MSKGEKRAWLKGWIKEGERVCFVCFTVFHGSEFSESLRCQHCLRRCLELRKRVGRVRVRGCVCVKRERGRKRGWEGGKGGGKGTNERNRKKKREEMREGGRKRGWEGGKGGREGTSERNRDKKREGMREGWRKEGEEINGSTIHNYPMQLIPNIISILIFILILSSFLLF